MATFCEDKEQMDKTVTCWAPVRRTGHQKTAGSQGWLLDNRKRIEDGNRDAEAKSNDKKAGNQVVPSHRTGYLLTKSAHDLTHTQYRAWCRHFVLARRETSRTSSTTVRVRIMIRGHLREILPHVPG